CARAPMLNTVITYFDYW
nr:immunoglobulin heavy chain junction region [Macaca mulatta]MOX37753.1 immunoglobulin heavy chain junction region [Macaca mulatta]MOX37784.1 immunoglobulin heavy chain junction region [Macaca mulatta]MOX37823.1 immunoglobulin heavy chain junction region [Macaca mulatta]MOX37828.1 immunoglobulin heavy chain junction region [Macaca mulatta]